MDNNKNKMILKYCPNFYRIINFDYFEDDYLTEKLINIYKKFIFNVSISSEDDIKIAKNIDVVLSKYIDDYLFRKEMKKELLQLRVSKNSPNILKTIVEGIITIFNKYEEGTTRKIYISRWI